jgi:cell division protein FtsB
MITKMLRGAKVLVWLIPFSLLAGAILVVPLRILDRQGLPRYRALSEELIEVRRYNAQARRTLQRLEVKVRALRNRPEAIERIARDELGLLFKDELLFQFSREYETFSDSQEAKEIVP